ncbi:MAG TPA: hypothetical protein VHQ87_18205, partial [Rhizobacter sp.]|nr:hypothetical protein [Rhizobacter sp.]
GESTASVMALAQFAARELRVDTYAVPARLQLDSTVVADGSIAYVSRVSTPEGEAVQRFTPRRKALEPPQVEVPEHLQPGSWPPTEVEPTTHTTLRDASAAAPKPEALVLSGDQWPELLAAMKSGSLSADGELNVYLFQRGGAVDPQQPASWAASSGEFKGWVHLPEGSNKPRWLGQSLPGTAPGVRAEATGKLAGLGTGELSAQHFLVVSRTPPREMLAANGFSDVAWGSHDELGQLAPVAVPAAGAAVNASTTAAAPAAEATSGRRLAALFGASTLGAFVTGSASAATVGNLHLLVTDPMLTGPLSFMYRGGVAAARTRVTERINFHLGEFEAGNSAPAHLDWLETVLLRRGGMLGIPKEDRANYALAIEQLRQDGGDTTALAVLQTAPSKVLSPSSLAGKLNDGLQLGTLAINNGNTALWFANHGFHADNPATWSNLIFVSANVVLSARNFAGRLGYTAKVKELGNTIAMKASQVWVMGGYAAGSVPLATNDIMVSPTPLGAAKAALDLTFGYGAARQGVNDARAIGSRPPLKSRVAPLVILGGAAIGRFGLELLALANRKDDKGQTPGVNVIPTTNPTAYPTTPATAAPTTTA